MTAKKPAGAKAPASTSQRSPAERRRDAAGAIRIELQAVDGPVPDMHKYADLGIDPEAFREWLTPLVIGLRNALQIDPAFAETDRSRAEERADLDKLMLHAEGMVAFMEVGGLSRWASAELRNAAYQETREQWGALRARLRKDVRALANSLARVQRTMDADGSGSGGRPSSLAKRDELARVIVDKLVTHGCKKYHAVEVAHDILTRCALPVPAKSDDLARLLRKRT